MATVLLIHADGTNASTAVVDEVGHAITANGNAQISTTQSKYGGASLYLDGTGDYLTLADHADWLFGSGDFTVEAWIRVANVSGTKCIAGQWGVGSAAWHFSVSGNRLYFAWSSGGAFSITGTTLTVAADTWHHAAVVKKGTTVTLYLDGVADATTGTISGAIDDSAASLTVGVINTTDGGYYNGYLDEIRITKGEALYTANFTVPSHRFFYQDTVLQLSMDGTNGGSTFTDAAGHSVTVGGTVTNSTTQVKYGTTSAYFAAGSNTLTSASDSATTFGTGDFTIEFWFYPTTSSGQQNILSTNGTTLLTIYYIASTLRMWSVADRIIGGALTLNAWSHITLCRYNGVSKLYINGTQTGSSYTDSNNYNNTAFTVGNASPYNLNGAYVDDLRICKSAKYVAAFTPPTAALDYEYTKLLIHGDGVDTSTCIREEVGRAVFVAGNTKISTTQSKLGGSSIVFDGTGDHLAITANADYGFGTGDFTVEFWIYWNGFPSSNAASIIGTYSSSSIGWVIQYRNDTTNRLRLGMTGDTNNLDFAWTPSTGQWYHVAVTRSGSSVRAFVDGTQIGTTQTNSSSMDGSTELNIGRLNFSGGLQYINAYMDEIRITKGLARYTTNFTPVTTPYTLLGQHLYTISGIVKDDTGANTSRTVRLYRRDNGTLMAETVSDGTSGAFVFSNPNIIEHYVVVLDDAAGTQYNALIRDRIIPT